ATVSVMGIPPCLRISQRRPFQSRRAAAARLCLQPLLSLPTGLTLPEPAGGDLRILLDGGSAPSPDVGRRGAAPIIPNAGMLQAARRPDTAHGGSRARSCCRVARRGRRDAPPSACR